MSLLAADNFDRPDNTDLGTNWTPIADGTTGGDHFTIAGNAAQAAAPSSLDACEGYTGSAWPNDQWAEAILAGVSASGVGAGAGAAARTVAGSPSTFDAYRAIANGSGYEVGVFLNGVFTSLASGSVLFAAGDRIYLGYQGSAWNAVKNTTDGEGGTSVASGTDSSVAAGTAGIAHSTVDAGAAIDSWQGGDFLIPDPIPQVFPFVVSQEVG